MKKKMPKLVMGAILTSLIMGSGLSVAAAEIEPIAEPSENITPQAVPLEVNFSPLEVRPKKGISSYFVDHQMSWGGGATGTYNVTWNNDAGYTTKFSTNSYTWSRTTTYQLSSGVASDYWYPTLEVTNGETKRVKGYVRLVR